MGDDDFYQILRAATDLCRICLEAAFPGALIFNPSGQLQTCAGSASRPPSQVPSFSNLQGSYRPVQDLPRGRLPGYPHFQPSTDSFPDNDCELASRMSSAGISIRREKDPAHLTNAAY